MLTTITRRTRSLGYALTTNCEQTAHGLRVVRPKAPDFVGTPKQVEAEAARQRRLYASGGTDFREAMFLGGKRIVKIGGMDARTFDLFMFLDQTGKVEVETE